MEKKPHIAHCQQKAKVMLNSRWLGKEKAYYFNSAVSTHNNFNNTKTHLPKYKITCLLLNRYMTINLDSNEQKGKQMYTERMSVLFYLRYGSIG